MEDELSNLEIMDLWPQIRDLKPEKVIFTGGEPLLRTDILELIRGLKHADPGHRILRCLNTNGSLVTAQRARDLVGLVDEVRVSLDALEDVNDFIRGEGHFAIALNALKICTLSVLSRSP